MIRLYEDGVWLLDGTRIVPDPGPGRPADPALTEKFSGGRPDKESGARQTISWSVLKDHQTGEGMEDLRIRFDKLTSHDITFVGIIQTARASGLERFPMPYVLTNCHNSLCAVGGTINEDDHMFGLSCARKYGGVYVPPHQAVIHQYAREMLAESGAMILGSDSHTRYGALGTMAVGEGGPELVKQLLGQTYDIRRPEVIAVYLKGRPAKGVGPQDVALAIIGRVFKNEFVKNRIMEFVGPGVENLSADFRIGIDVMTTETACLSSIWQTDSRIREFYEIHGRPEAYRELRSGPCAWYDGCIEVDLDKIEPMIAMPFHPSNTYTIRELKENLDDIIEDTQKKAKVSLGAQTAFSLRDKIRDGRMIVDQGIIAGCAGGGFENICAAADILRGSYIGTGPFTLSVYPASTPIYRELAVDGILADLIESGAVVKTAFCGPCFGAGDTPANNAFSIRHSTRNFPNREGSKPGGGQIASVALMDARSIAATAAREGVLTAATELDREYRERVYHFDSRIYANRVFDAVGKAEPDAPIVMGPNIKDWPVMQALPENLLLKVVSEIHDPVTTTDELIPSGETSSYRSNPQGLAEFTLSRKDPEYVGLAKEVRAGQEAIVRGEDPGSVLADAAQMIRSLAETWMFDPADAAQFGIGSAIYAVKPGDGSAREQAASCQKVLGGWANIAQEYATKRYRSNLINWGMLPLMSLEPQDRLSFAKGSYLFLPDIRKAILEKEEKVTAYALGPNEGTQLQFALGYLTDDERQIILDGCLINYNRA